MKKLIWIVFILLSVLMYVQGIVIKENTAQHYTLIGQEFANKYEGMAAISVWGNTIYGDGRLLDKAISNTHWDFLFILCYVSLIILHSQNQMQREPNSWLNSLLRFNLLLAVLAGLSDIGENLVLLHNFRHFSDRLYYIETWWLTVPKFILAGWAVLVFLISLVSPKKSFRLQLISTSHRLNL